ncbi:MAG: YdcF family protein [Pseudomonadota bacterium]
MDDLFFSLSKAIWILIQPSKILLLLLGLGLILLWTRWRRFGRALASVAGLVLAIAGLLPIGQLLLLPLENRFVSDRQIAPEGIIVLGGAYDARVSKSRGMATFGASVDRILALHHLTRQYPDAEVVIAGTGDADAVAGLQSEWGLDGVEMVFDNVSRSTAEHPGQAAKVAKTAIEENWLLVTSAYHIPRAMGVFRKAGWSVHPYPVDHLTIADGLIIRPNVSVNLIELDLAAKEWVGLLAYRLTGRTESLFPHP